MCDWLEQRSISWKNFHDTLKSAKFVKVFVTKVFSYTVNIVEFIIISKILDIYDYTTSKILKEGF